MMGRMRLLMTVVLAVVLGATPLLAAKPGRNWQDAAAGADRKRLARLWEAWTGALADVAAHGETPALTALGPVAVPDAGTMHANPDDRIASPAKGPLPGPGAYLCRTIRLGQQENGAQASRVQAGEPQPCRIDIQDTGLWFEQEAGSNRLAGRLYADGDRLVFLGATALRGEMGVMPYRADPERNAVGALRALGPAHWRLELPWPSWQSTLDLVEITPR
jgi:hypothetical protein